MRVMFDSVTISRIPHNAQMVAGYTSGSWPTFPTLAGLFPNAVRVSIAIDATHDANVLDVENGDATPQQAVGWVTRQRAQGHIPTVYCNTSTWPAVKAAFSIANVALPLWWRADYNGHAELEMGEIAHQYTDGVAPVSAPNRVSGCDTSAVADYWPGVDPPQEDDMQPVDLLNALDAAAKSTEAGTPVPGTEFIDAIARRVVAMQAAAKGTTP